MLLNPGNVRLLLFGGLLTLLFALSIKNTRTALYLLILYLPFLGFIRRALIPISGWRSFDPLVILPALIILILGIDWVYRAKTLKRDIWKKETLLFRLVIAMLLIDFFQIFNPLQGGLMVGFGGVLFYIVPLFWMILSREYFNDRMIRTVIATVFVIAIFSALYGLKQTYWGFYSFEDAWVDITGYAALRVGQSVRAYSFFTSAAEYAQYLAIGIIIAWVLVLRARFILKIVALAVLPLLIFALFMESARTIVVTTAFGIGIISIVNASTALKKIITLVVVAIGIGVVYSFITTLNVGDNDLLAHQVNGLANPLDEEHSTATLHMEMAVNGFAHGFRNPVGTGLGSTTLAGAKLGNGGNNAEVDLSNMFISNGIIGGFVYLLLMVTVLKTGFFMASKQKTIYMIVLGILLVSFGSWSTGGNYSSAALIWMLIGYLDKSRKEYTETTG